MKLRHLLLATLIACVTAPAAAQVVVKDAWVRATVAQQKATGAFLQITSPSDARLVAVSAAGVPVAEIHEMSMHDGVMKMRAVPSLALPAGQAVALKPGGYHVMLMDLKQPLTAGSTLPLTLVVEDQAGKRERIEVQAQVRAPGAAAQPAHGH